MYEIGEFIESINTDNINLKTIEINISKKNSFENYKIEYCAYCFLLYKYSIGEYLYDFEDRRKLIYQKNQIFDPFNDINFMLNKGGEGFQKFFEFEFYDLCKYENDFTKIIHLLNKLIIRNYT